MPIKPINNLMMMIVTTTIERKKTYPPIKRELKTLKPKGNCINPSLNNIR